MLRKIIIAQFLFVLCLAWPEVRAWGPHPQITKAALEVLPHIEEVKAQLGEENVMALMNYCWMPDMRGRDLGTFYADDYLLIRALPRHIGHTMPAVSAAFEPYFRRALQALRTESPANACRQLGTLVHFVEDVGAPPHAKENCPHHSELENWVDAQLITIQGYQPRLLGQSDEEALQGLQARIAELVAFSKERAERALPIVSSPNPDRSKVEEIILESAIESAKVTADLLFTMFTLGLRPNSGPGQSTLRGTITAPAAPGNDDQSPRVVLLNTDYSTLAEATSIGSSGGWQGKFVFRQLPAGKYQLFVYRIGAQPAILPIELRDGEMTHVTIELIPSDPQGNLVYNPDGKTRVLVPDLPDRWSMSTSEKAKLWSSTVVPLKAGEKYRCGAVIKAVGTKVSLQVSQGKGSQSRRLLIGQRASPEDESRYEIEFVAEPNDTTLSIQVETGGDLSEAIDKVWVVSTP